MAVEERYCTSLAMLAPAAEPRDVYVRVKRLTAFVLVYDGRWHKDFGAGSLCLSEELGMERDLSVPPPLGLLRCFAFFF